MPLTKIVCTLGPATDNDQMIRAMMRSGMTVARLNFSHGSHENHLKVIKNIKELNEELSCNVAIMADLQGPKLRIGEIENNSIDLQAGEEITFVTTQCVGNKDRLYMSYPEFPKDLSPGDNILIDDGKIIGIVSYNNMVLNGMALDT